MLTVSISPFSLPHVTCATSLPADRSKWHNAECQASISTKHWNQINHLAWSVRGAVPEQANNTFFSLLSLLFPGPLCLSGKGPNCVIPWLHLRAIFAPKIKNTDQRVTAWLIFLYKKNKYGAGNKPDIKLCSRNLHRVNFSITSASTSLDYSRHLLKIWSTSPRDISRYSQELLLSSLVPSREPSGFICK